MSIPKKPTDGANSASEDQKRRKAPVLPGGTIRNPRIQTAIHFMNSHLERQISLADIASVTRLSPSHLSHLFKTQTGLSPGEYLRRLKMEKASQLLTTTLLSIKEIMAIVGYNNRSNFLRHFRRYYDVAPSEYRERNYIIVSRK
jgi:transcriptional regulator GlxA family with amidase domain